MAKITFTMKNEKGEDVLYSSKEITTRDYRDYLVLNDSLTSEKSEVEEVPKSEEETEDKLEFEIEEEPESKEGLEELNLLPARGTCRRKPLRNCYREEKGVQRNSWRKEKCKWRLS